MTGFPINFEKLINGFLRKTSLRQVFFRSIRVRSYD